MTFVVDQYCSNQFCVFYLFLIVAAALLVSAAAALLVSECENPSWGVILPVKLNNQAIHQNTWLVYEYFKCKCILLLKLLWLNVNNLLSWFYFITEGGWLSPIGWHKSIGFSHGLESEALAFLYFACVTVQNLDEIIIWYKIDTERSIQNFVQIWVSKFKI